jgi:hypothetical protein
MSTLAALKGFYEQEKDQPLKLIYLSIGSLKGWLGAFIVCAHGPNDAMLKLIVDHPDIQPDHVLGSSLSDDMIVPESDQNRLLTKLELEAIFGKLEHLRTNLCCGHTRVVEDQ